MKLHHLTPFVFVLSFLIPFLLGAIGYFAHFKYTNYIFLLCLIPIFLHFLAGSFFSIKIAFKEKKMIAFILPLLFFIFHVCYGFGTLTGFLKNHQINSIQKK